MASEAFTTEEISEIVRQCADEYEHALKYRQKREADWQAIEDLYYGKKKKSLITRANIHIPKMQGTIETFVSKIDDEPIIHFEAMEEADKPKEVRLNALIRRDMNIGDWALKDVVAKKEGATYGRAIFKKYSTSEGGFTDYLEVVDVLDFLIDPLAGGLTPIERARYLGQDNIIRTVDDLKDDVYDQSVVEAIATKLASDRDADNQYASIQARRSALGLSDAVLVSANALRLVEWYTYFKGRRVYCLFSPEFMSSVRTCPLTEVSEADEFPFATWAPFPRLSEFWTPGIGELIKEPNIVQNIILSQILDNNAYRNYGQVFYDSTKITNPADLIPKPMGKIPVNGSPREAIMERTFPQLDNAVAAYNLVENIFDKEVGVNANAKGMPNSKRMSATEFAGLLDQVADRFFAANKTYKHCLRRLGMLYKHGAEENMTADLAVRILGATGLKWVKVSGKDIKGDFDILVSTGASEEQNRNLMRDRFGEFVVRNRKNPRMNQRFLDEKEAQIFGFEQNEIERLLNPELEGDWEILAEAAGENEKMLSKDVSPNKAATTGHIEKHLQYLRTTDKLSMEQRRRILAHAKSELPIAQENEKLRANKLIQDQFGARNLDINQQLAENIQNPPPNRSIAPPEGVDTEDFNAALQGQYPGSGAGNAPEVPADQAEQVRQDAIRNAPNAAGVQPSA